MAARRSFKYITTEATEAVPSWSLREFLEFHYFNPNGACAAKALTDTRITAAVEAGKCKSGAIIAYGSMNSFHKDKLYKLLSSLYNSKSRLGRIGLHILVRAVYEQARDAQEFLDGLDA